MSSIKINYAAVLITKIKTLASQMTARLSSDADANLEIKF